MTNEWVPSTAQLKLAQQLALGFSLLKSSEKAEVPYRTAQTWYHYPGKAEFIALVEELREEMVNRYEDNFGRVLNLALEIELQVYAREISPDDPVAKFAHDTLTKTAYRAAALHSLAAQNAVRRRHPSALPPPGSFLSG